MSYTLEQLKRVFPRGDIRYLEAYLRSSFANAESDLVQAHFLAQVAHETGGFKFFEELGDMSYFRKYDTRQDLGNTHLGDGYHYRGRGLIMLTGKANYANYGKILQEPLAADPDLAKEPNIAMRVAALFWKINNLTTYAERDMVKKITRRINGGLNGLHEREEYLKRLKKIADI